MASKNAPSRKKSLGYYAPVKKGVDSKIENTKTKIKNIKKAIKE